MDASPGDGDSSKSILKLLFKAKVYLKPFFYPRP
jgi:hypothetical protein